MKRFLPVFLVLGLTAVISLGSCTEEEPEQTLYTRLGGIDAISGVVDQFLQNVAADTTINAYFSATVADPYRVANLRNHLIDQICEVSGGPCIYKGKSMMAAHQGMNISEEDFNALVADLVASLNQFAVPQPEQDELLGALGGLKTDIVGQ